MMKILLVSVLLCSSVLGLHMATQKYYTNTDVENYIEGGPQGQINYLNSVTLPPNAVKCPFHAPFTIDGNKCFQCTLSLPIFNLDTLRCETCPLGVKSLKNHQCQ